MPRFSDKSKSRLYADLAKYAHSGIGIQVACESMLKQSRLSKPPQRFCQELITGLSNGASIAGSLKELRLPITSLEVAVVDAAERGGAIEQAFDYLATHFKSSHETRRRIIRSLIYPLILMHFAIVVSVFGTTIFSSFGPNSDGIDWSKAWSSLRIVGWIYLLAIVLLVIGYRLWKQIPSSVVIDRLVSKIPIWGSAYRTLAWQRFCGAFGLFMKSGLKSSEGFRGAGPASQSAEIHRVSKQCANGVEEGQEDTLGEIFQSHRLFPDDFVQGISAADASGRLDQEFQWWSEHYRDEARQKIDLVAKWTPKVFYFFVVGLVGWLVIRVANSYYEMLGQWIDQI